MRPLLLFLPLSLLPFVPPAQLVSLQAGAHLDLNVVVMVQKEFSSGCQNMDQLASNSCLARKCAQNVQYKVDLGYSKVRLGVDGVPLQQLAGFNMDTFLAKKRQLSSQLSAKVRRLNNDAFQPFLFNEFEMLLAEFYDGHSRILALFDLSMEDLLMAKGRLTIRLGDGRERKGKVKVCAQLDAFGEAEGALLTQLERSWLKKETKGGTTTKDDGQEQEEDQQKHAAQAVPPLTLFEVLQRRISPPTISLIMAYNERGPDKPMAELIKHTNQLFRLLVRLSTQSRAHRQKVDKDCLSRLSEVDRIIKNESLVARLHYNTARSLLVRNVEALLRTKAAVGQYGKYFQNNMATLRFRFMAMTAVRMQEYREYSNFNLLGPSNCPIPPLPSFRSPLSLLSHFSSLPSPASVDLGSTLGLYFGLTILTLFEMLIFLLYRSESDTKVQKLPPASVVYNIPANPTFGTAGSIKRGRLAAAVGAGARQRRRRKGEEAEREEWGMESLPVIF